MFRKILTANDGSTNAFKALEAACDLAARYRAQLHMILVEETPAIPASITEARAIKAVEDRRVRAHIKRAEAIAARRQAPLTPRVRRTTWLHDIMAPSAQRRLGSRETDVDRSCDR